MSSPTPSLLQELYDLSYSSPGFSNRLYTILCQQEYMQCEKKLESDGLVQLIDCLDEALGHLDPSSKAYWKCLRELRSICVARVMLPTSYTLPSQRLEIGRVPVTCGGFGDVYMGTLVGVDSKSTVCIKRTRTYIWGDKHRAKIFYKEAVTWKHLKHPNILPLLGITTEPWFQLISEWVSGGNLRGYILENPDADRHKLLCDVAQGLHYLHSHHVIHGDIKGLNVLVKDPCNALIADFGLAKISRKIDPERYTSNQKAFSVRWAAPEVINGGEYSEEADIYSFAMVVIEVFTGAAPPTSATTTDDRPPRPTHPTFTDGLWELVKRCWDKDPCLRPEVSKVLEVLRDPDLPTWKQLILFPLSTDERTSLITSTFSDRDDFETVGRLSGSDIQPFINTIDEVFGSLTLEIRRRCLYYLSKICGRHGLLPKSLPNPLCDHLAGTVQYYGRHAIVRKGCYNGQEIAVKVLKNPGSDFLKQTKERFHEAVTIWKTLHHPNVLSLLGVTITGNQFTTVSEWMTNGNANEFIRVHPVVDRLGLLADAIKGLTFLHDHGIVHGNLNGSNILVGSDGHARLAGFTLLTVVPDELIAPPSRSLDITMQFEGGIQWSAPEILMGEGASKATDIFALAMIFSGTTPFGNLQDTVAILTITRNKRPPRPMHPSVSKGLWELIQRCWSERPSSRPEAQNVLESFLNSSLPAWKQLISPTLSTSNRADLMIRIFSDRGEFEALKHLSGSDAQAFVDVINEVLDGSDDLPQQIRGRCLRVSNGICGREALLPKSLLIPLCYNPMETPSYFGGLADVWKSSYNGRAVAVKVLRVYVLSDFDKIRRRFCKEATTWKALRHPNVLPLLGVTMTGNRLATVSEWMGNGNVNEFVKARPDVNRLTLLAEATRGLIYMHDQGIIHGNLKGSNILIDDNGCARLADFGLIALLPDQSLLASSYTGNGAIQWMSPELVDPTEPGQLRVRPTRESDCYAFGMVVYEVLSGQAPFARYSGFIVTRVVLEGGRPDKPEGVPGGWFPDTIWELLGCCWEHQPANRPNLNAVLLCLQDASQGWSPPPNTETNEKCEEREDNEGNEDWDIDFDDQL